jgi:uncharacterized membrane protein YfcA
MDLSISHMAIQGHGFLLPFAVSGAAVGLLVGLTGVGGGSLMTPLLTLAFSVVPAVAVGTDLAFAAITKGAGTLFHRDHGHVNWGIVIRLTLGSLASATLTLMVLKQAGPPSPAWHDFTRLVIAISVLLTAFSLIFRKRLLKWIQHHPQFQPQGSSLDIATVIVGLVLGMLVTLSSIGAGAIGASLILLLYPRLKPAEVAGTDIACAVPLTTLAALGHWWLGNVNGELLAGLLLGSIPGIWIGAQLSRRLPERYIRAALAALLTLTGIKLVV